MTDKRKLKELIGILMESTFYFEMPLRERAVLIRYIMDGELLSNN